MPGLAPRHLVKETAPGLVWPELLGSKLRFAQE